MGTLSDARLSGNVARLNANQIFTGQNTLTNPANLLAGNGFGLTLLNSAQLQGPVPTHNIAGTYPESVVFSHPGNSFTGDGSGLNPLNASSLASGIVPDSRLSGNVALRSNANTFIGNQTFNGGIAINSSAGFSQSSLGGFNIDAAGIPGG